MMVSAKWARRSETVFMLVTQVTNTASTIQYSVSVDQVLVTIPYTKLTSTTITCQTGV